MFTTCYISTAIASPPLKLKRLLPPADPADVREIVAGLGLHERATGVPITPTDRPLAAPTDARRTDGRQRPYVLLNMVSTLDGRATLEGRSGPLSDDADRALFHGLRSVVDAVMAGAGTVRSERYGPIVRDPDTRRRRREQGLREQPLACIVSAGLRFPPDLPLLRDPASEVAFLTASRATLPEATPPQTTARLEYIRPRHEDGSLDLTAALCELHDRLHVRTLLCEGGPHLNAELLSAGLVDELFLSVAPLLAGEDTTDARPPLRILAGSEFEPPLELELLAALAHDSHLFLRYRLRTEAG